MTGKYLQEYLAETESSTFEALFKDDSGNWFRSTSRNPTDHFAGEKMAGV